jgi:hypothetical protein
MTTGRNMSKYRHRQSQYGEWQERFPQCSETDLSDFLETVNRGFMLPKSLRDRIHPDDTVAELYLACIGKWPVDNMEVEHLLINLEDRFSWVMPEDIDLQIITFGEMLAQVLTPK